MHSTCSCIISLGLCSLCIQIAPYQMSAFIVHTFFFLPFSIEHFHANFSFFRCWDYSGGLGFFCLPFTLNTTWPKQSLSFQVYVLKRPHVDEFLQRMGELFECVLFTASLAKYADPVADLLDRWGVFRARLFRESCVFHRGNYVKDLSRLGRELSKVIIVDNSPASYIFHPENAVPVQSWFDDMTDTELLDLIPFFEGLSKEEEVYSMLHKLCNR